MGVSADQQTVTVFSQFWSKFKKWNLIYEKKKLERFFI